MMDNSETIAVIVPCFNEANRLPIETFHDFLSRNSAITLYFVDDGSTDGSADMLQALCDRAGNRVRLISYDKNAGKAVAVRLGMLEAMQGGFSYIAYWDADLSTPLEELPRLLQALKQHDVDWVMGARLKILGCDIDRHLHRHLAGRVFATFASITLQLPVYDTQCGAKLFINGAYLPALVREEFIGAWTFDVRFVMHPVTRKKLLSSGWYGKLEGNSRIELIDRLPYSGFMKMLRKASFLVTDGGSNQEEASYIGLPCLLLRRATERHEGLGSNVTLSMYDLSVMREFIGLHGSGYVQAEDLSAVDSPSDKISHYLSLFA